MLALRTLCLCLGIIGTLGIPRDVLYPFGDGYDEKLTVGDDLSSEEIQLQVPIAFYDDMYRSVYVNLNGHLTFETDLPVYRSDLVIPFGFRMIAPFLADVDTRLSGNVYYRETRDPSLLEMAAGEIHPNFPSKRNFQPRALFIVTWDNVGSFDRQYDDVNTFQVVIPSDGRDSFVMFFYPEINWDKGQGKNGPSFPDVPGQVGFDGGEGKPSFTLPGSGNEHVRRLADDSNSGVAGVWMYRIGSLYPGENIQNPEIYVDPSDDETEQPTSCAAGGNRLCNPNGQCTDYDGGYCCSCLENFVGNGINCLSPDVPMRVNGKVTGNINGIALVDSDLHAFLMFNDGRSYIAISRVPSELGPSMQGLYTFAGGMGWLLALTSSGESMNGYMITGGDFERNVRVSFLDSGESVDIQQTVKGQNAEGYMEMHSVINGNIPYLQTGSAIEIPDYQEQYRRISPGVIKSAATHTFTVDGAAIHFSVDQTISYTECPYKPITGEAQQSVSVSRSFLHYEEDAQQIVRYAQSNQLGSTGADPCQDGSANCGRNADCVPDGATYRCVCSQGYSGDGRRCDDVDECATRTHDCHQYAHCYNVEGSFQCRCSSGYTGDGRDCRQIPGGGCDTLECDINANCIFDEYYSRYTCECNGNTGYTGDGYVCQRTQDCSVYNYCSRDARCLPSHSIDIYKCVCNEGFEGDGETCREASCNVINNCDINSDCLYDPIYQSYQCQCRQGYEGDGFSCRLSADCRRDQAICDPNARCENRGFDYICVCNPGYRGDGYRCAPLGDKESYLMFAQGMTIMQMPFNPSDSNPGKAVLTIPGQTAIGIDVDCFSRYFYWTDVSGQVISKAQLDGTDSQTLVSGLGSPEGVAVDWITGNMYWTDSGLDRIEVSKTDGTYRKSLISEDLHDPRGIIIDPISGTMFWTDWHRSSPKIESASMDGSDRRIIVDDDLGLPNGLTLDFQSHHVCWVDAETKRIECVNYEGSGRRTIYAHTDYPFDLTYTHNVFYWTDWHDQYLPSITKFSSEANKGIELPDGGHGRLYGIAVVKSQCPTGTNACALNNGGCRFLCMPTPNGGRTCECPDDIDQEQCNRIGKHL